MPYNQNCLAFLPLFLLHGNIAKLCKVARKIVDTRRVSLNIVIRGFFKTPIEYPRFSGNLTLFCCYHIPYFTHKSQIIAIFRAEQSWPDQMLLPTPTL